MTPRAANALAHPESAGACTVAEARRALAQKFRVAGLDSPDLDARILVGHALGLDHAALAAAGARALGAAERAAIAALAARRLAREPVARVVGRTEFWSLPLRVDAATLVPRPETETAVEAALAAIDSYGTRAGVGRIADLGTGSGALLLALLTELPNATGIGTDTSLEALAVARDNARRLGLSRAQFVACDMAAALGAPFDLIVSNPPYIASGAIAHSHRRCAISTRARRWTADPTVSTSIGRSRPACRRCSGPAARLSSNLALAKPRPLPPCFRRRGLHPHRPAPM